MSRELDKLEDMLQMQGLKEGTPEWEKVMLREKVNRCMRVRNVESCRECALFTDCELRLSYWRLETLGPEYSDATTESDESTTETDIPEEDS